MLKRELDLILKEIQTFSTGQDGKKRKLTNPQNLHMHQQHLAFNRTPRYMSQNHEKKALEVKNEYENKQRNRIFMFQRENLNTGNEKRSLSKNSTKSIEIKNRTRSSYSHRGLIVSSKEKN